MGPSRASERRPTTEEKDEAKAFLLSFINLPFAVVGLRSLCSLVPPYEDAAAYDFFFLA